METKAKLTRQKKLIRSSVIMTDIMQTQLSYLWPTLNGSDLLILGTAAPILPPAWLNQVRIGLTALATKKTNPFPYRTPRSPLALCQVDYTALPFYTNFFDFIILYAGNMDEKEFSSTLLETQKIMNESGRLLILVPCRENIADFLSGQQKRFHHHSAYRIQKNLVSASLEKVHITRTLFFPVTRYASSLSLDTIRTINSTIDLIGHMTLPALAGILLVEARKRFMAPISVSSRHKKYVRKKEILLHTTRSIRTKKN